MFEGWFELPEWEYTVNGSQKFGRAQVTAWVQTTAQQQSWPVSASEFLKTVPEKSDDARWMGALAGRLAQSGYRNADKLAVAVQKAVESNMTAKQVAAMNESYLGILKKETVSDVAKGAVGAAKSIGYGAVLPAVGVVAAAYFITR